MKSHGRENRPTDTRPSKGPMDSSHALKGVNSVALAGEHVERALLIGELGIGDIDIRTKHERPRMEHTVVSPAQAALIAIYLENNK